MCQLAEGKKVDVSYIWDAHLLSGSLRPPTARIDARLFAFIQHFSRATKTVYVQMNAANNLTPHQLMRVNGKLID